jgi:hypothetical protein
METIEFLIGESIRGPALGISLQAILGTVILRPAIPSDTNSNDLSEAM